MVQSFWLKKKKERIEEWLVLLGNFEQRRQLIRVRATNGNILYQISEVRTYPG